MEITLRSGLVVAKLRASRSRQSAVARRARPLVPMVLLLVVWTVVTSEPAPALQGRGLATTVALAAFILCGLGAVTLREKHAPLRDALTAALVIPSVTLAWLQPQGLGIVGVFVATSLLAWRLRAHRPPLVILASVALLVGLDMHHGRPMISSLLDAVTATAFYGITFLAIRLEEANQLAEQLISELEQSRTELAQAASLAERQHVAREMHDILAHTLSGLILQLEGARMLVHENPKDPQLPLIVQRAHQLAHSGLEEARHAVGTLRDGPLPGLDRLAELCQQFEEDHGIACRLRQSGEPRQLTPASRLTLYRVAQEALTNVARHSPAEQVQLDLEYRSEDVRLIVEDFVPAPREADQPRSQHPHPGEGYGLAGMRERAAVLGGFLAADRTPTGFRVELRVPAPSCESRGMVRS